MPFPTNLEILSTTAPLFTSKLKIKFASYFFNAVGRKLTISCRGVPFAGIEIGKLLGLRFSILKTEESPIIEKLSINTSFEEKL